MSKNSTKITVAMARVASITLGRDIENKEDIEITLGKLSRAFQTSIQTILPELEALSVKPLAISISSQGVTCGIEPSVQPAYRTSDDSWNDAIQKLGDAFISHGASVVVENEYAKFIVPINAVKPVLLDNLKIGQPV